MSTQKYVRHSKLGFIVWPNSQDLFHAHIGNAALHHMRGAAKGDIISAGFVDIEKGVCNCYGYSESLEIGCITGDNEAFARQFGLIA